ncbi:MAG: Hsp33 family molecular chaperone HslO [Pseudomonadales bacterium]|nr:Hsp33 family molecular chaperone HslO [Pseudomonadales bacterium]
MDKTSDEQPGANPGDDESRRFLFEEADIRGETVRLMRAFRSITTIHQYAPGVRRMLGEILAAAVLLRSTLKFEGKLVLQARSGGQIPLLMAECNTAGDVRGIARGAATATATRFDQLLGDGQLAITIDPLKGRRYQGIVPLSGDSLAHSLDGYFAQSEQLGTRIWLASDGHRAGGLLLQQLPPQLARDAEQRARQWEHACTLAATVEPRELLELPARELAHRLYHQDSLRLFPGTPLRFHCSCSRERTRNALSALGSEEVQSLLQEMGVITMDCEFCNQQYRFAREDLQDILGPTLH